MKQSLQNFLDTVSVESDDNSVNGEEITINTDETRSDLEELLTDLSEKTKENNREIDQVIEATETLLSAEAFISAQIANIEANVSSYNRVVQEVAFESVVAHLSGLKLPHTLYKDLEEVNSFEAAEGADGKEQATKDVGKFRKVIDRIVALLKSLGNLIKNALGKVKERLTGLKGKSNKASQELDGIVNGLKGEPTGKLKAKSYSDLLVENKPNPVEALAKVTKGLPLITEQSESAIVLLNNLNAFAESGFTDSKLIAGDNINANRVYFALASKAKSGSFELAGGRTFTFGIDKKAKKYSTTVSSPSAVDGEVDVPNKQTLVACLKAVKNFDATIQKAIDNVNKVSAEVDKVLTKVTERKSNPTVTFADSLVAPYLTAIASAVPALNETSIRYSTVVSETVTSSLKFVKDCAAKYSAEPAKAADPA